MSSKAASLQRQSQESEKITHEFIAVCMLSALYGNPNLNLVQLHPAYAGPRTVERDILTYGSLAVDQESGLQTEKKRRNAVTEVLRFYCQQVHKVDQRPSQDAGQIYEVALKLLRNGDIRGAVKYLNANKKSRMAMIVARSVNSRYSMDQFESYLKGTIGVNNRKPFLALCAHISSGDEEAEASQAQLPWE